MTSADAIVDQAIALRTAAEEAPIDLDARRRGLAEGIALAGDHLNADRFLDEYGEDIRWCPDLGTYYIWNGIRWEQDRREMVQEMARQTIDGLRSWVGAAGSDDEFKRRSAHYTASAKAGRRDGLLQLARTDPRIVVNVDQLDQHPHLLAVANGVIDLRTGALLAADRKMLLTRGVDIAYDPGALSPEWEGFVGRAFEHQVDLIQYVQRLLGYCCTGEATEHILAVLHGEGANSKSTLIGVVQDVLLDLAITAPDGLLVRQHGEVHPERVAVLRGRRLVVSSELEQRAVLAEQVVKLLTGNDTLSARELYGRRFDFRPSHTVVLVTNHRPRVSGTDLAIWRRLKLVPFGVVIPLEEQDRTLRRRLVEEHGRAVLAWLVKGAVDWYANGLGTADAVDEATDDYRSSQDTMGAFLEEMTVTVDRARTKVGDLYDSWKCWAERSGERPGRRQDFSVALAEHGLIVETYQGTKFVLGVGIKADSGEVS